MFSRSDFTKNTAFKSYAVSFPSLIRGRKVGENNREVDESRSERGEENILNRRDITSQQSSKKRKEKVI